jgi:hypothetical protein
MDSLDDFLPLGVVLLGIIFAFTVKFQTPGAFYRTLIVSIVVFLVCVYISSGYTHLSRGVTYQMSAIATIIVAMVVNRFG